MTPTPATSRSMASTTARTGFPGFQDIFVPPVPQSYNGLTAMDFLSLLRAAGQNQPKPIQMEDPTMVDLVAGANNSLTISVPCSFTSSTTSSEGSSGLMGGLSFMTQSMPGALPERRHERIDHRLTCSLPNGVGHSSAAGETNLETDSDGMDAPLSPKTVEKMAKAQDKKRFSEENKDGSTTEPIPKRPRGRPRIYGTYKQAEELERKNKEVEEAAGAPAELADSDSVSKIGDGTKRRKYAANMQVKDDPKYLDMRRANNEAVKRNRDKAKRLQALKDLELERLRDTVNKLEKELIEEKDRVKVLNTQIETYQRIVSQFSANRQTSSAVDGI